MTAEPRPALPAASLVLLREAPGLQVLMGERPATATAFPGAWVFPGGKIDAQDHAFAGPDPERAARAAAIRETFEETGVLLALDADGRPCARPPVELAAARLAMEHGELGFAELLAGLGARPALEAVVPVARLVTPLERPRRFDTWFFLALAPEPDPALIPTTELARVEWVDVAGALRASGREARLLHPPTLMILRRLAARVSAEAAIEAARATVVEAMQL